eukprot:EC725283.1.p1 GENE.EC725283.1~~EC725283.1.p1  ORF type:complete len:181 (+),score=23.63 EC725283.1:94-636(+)
MYSLISGFVEHVTKKEEYFVLMVGLDNAGKSSILEKLKPIFSKQAGLPPERIVPTIGLNIGRFDVSGCRLVVWDLGGQSGMRIIWERYCRDAQAVVFVIDSAAPERFAEARETLHELLHHRALADLPLLVLANKQDISGAASADAVHEALPRMDPPRPLRVAPVSAVTTEGLIESFTWLV